MRTVALTKNFSTGILYQEVPQLNLQKIKIEHDRKRQMSGENPDHSPEQDFITAREATVEECGSTRDKSLADRENAKTGGYLMNLISASQFISFLIKV